MKQRLRKIIFWLHLGSGVTAGLIVALMSLTGAAMAFQPQLLRWVEGTGPGVVPPAVGASRLGVDELLARARAASPGVAPTALTVYPDGAAGVRVAAGRSAGVHVDPYTGQTQPLPGQGWREFFHVMIEWHRWLGTSADNREVGKAITGVCNAAFLFLALSGLYLWWPRRWSQRAMRLSLWFRRGLTSKTRDWNWHNVIGFWSLPVLIVVTASGMMISYRWVSDLIYLAAGEKPPAGPAGTAAPPPKVQAPAQKSPPPSLDVLLATIGREVPGWQSATLRMRAGRGAEGKSAGPQPLTLVVKEASGWPPFASVQLSLNPFTGQVLRKETFADATPGRQIRSWLRFLHTGEALGWPGQLVAGIACLGATLLVWTGFALAFRRLFGAFLRRRQGRTSEPAIPTAPQAIEGERRAS